MEKADSECLVFGMTSYTEFDFIKHKFRKYYYPPLYEPVSEEQTMATNQFNEYFKFHYETDLTTFKDAFEDDTVFEANHTLKRKIAKPDLSLAL
jgi:hypothetical protein